MESEGGRGWGRKEVEGHTYITILQFGGWGLNEGVRSEGGRGARCKESEGAIQTSQFHF